MLKIRTRIETLIIISLMTACIAFSQETDSSNSNIPAIKSDSSYFIISAIKTVSGEQPEDEFFDLNIKFKLDRKVFSLASFDVAISDVDTDTTQSSSDKLTEAGLSLNYGFHSYGNNGRQRQLYFGLKMKIFNGIPYYGLHLGSIELRASPFHTSYCNIGFLQRFYDTDSNDDASDINNYNNNLFIEFAFRSEDAPVIDALRIKAGILIPVFPSSNDPAPNTNDIKTRIVIEVPIQGIYSF